MSKQTAPVIAPVPVTILEPKYVRLAAEPSPVGFANTGTICWMNAFTQVLLGATAIKHAIEVAECDLAKNKMCLATARTMRNPTETSTAEMVSALEQMVTAADGGRKLFSGQQCAAEAFTYFVDALNHREVTGRIANVYAMTTPCGSCGRVGSDVRDVTTSIVLGTPERLTEDNFSIWLKKREVALEGYHCECGAPITSRIETLKTLRECVVFVMDKFHAKDRRFFPRKFSLGTVDGGILTWELIGVIEHAGAMSGGHYWAITRRGDNWYRCNDSSVAECAEPEPTPEAFIVVYHLV